MISFEHVSKSFTTQGKTLYAVKDVTLDIDKGEIFGIIGFSGAGKSTLLRLVNLLEQPTEGKVTVNQQDITALSAEALRQLRRRIGMVFQTFNLFQSRTVAGNVAWPLRLARMDRQQIQQRVDEVLRFVGLEDKKDHYPEQLSGGQKQRVGIARALVSSPDILICDEATSALDPETTEDILQLLESINRQYNITILLITHEMNVIRRICHRVTVMEQGRVIEQGRVVDIFTRPEHKTTRNFVRSIFNDRLPPRLLQTLQSRHSGALYQLIFHDGSTSVPLLSQTARLHPLIDYNIIYGNISELQGALFGSLIVEFIGPPDSIAAALETLAQTVEVREVSDEG
ncbi:ATP-binding cassette domain-containing protein [Pectobacterium versatile]|nr:ATP-binding cassette domain-containing protein [Pectobacterium versatile]